MKLRLRLFIKTYDGGGHTDGEWKIWSTYYTYHIEEKKLIKLEGTEHEKQFGCSFEKAKKIVEDDIEVCGNQELGWMVEE